PSCLHSVFILICSTSSSDIYTLSLHDALPIYSYFFSIASFLFVFMDLGGEFYQIKLFASGKNVNRLFNISVVKSILFLGIIIPRSEEHTSELQSRENLVCRLLLEKKKVTRTYT